jgi:hypothetical protein
VTFVTEPPPAFRVAAKNGHGISLRFAPATVATPLLFLPLEDTQSLLVDLRQEFAPFGRAFIHFAKNKSVEALAQRCTGVQMTAGAQHNAIRVPKPNLPLVKFP